MTESDSVETTSTSSSNPPPPIQKIYIHPRREPFEHGLIPIPKLTDAFQTLTSHKLKLLSLSAHSNRRVDSSAIAETLQIPPDHARLIIETIASVLHSDSDPLAAATPSEVESVGVDVCDLILFLYIQSYKRLLPRGHKDSAAVADVWPSTSAFDGFLSALSPLQLAQSNSRRSMPSQADEEAHQLSYIQKHLGNIVSLLSDSIEGEGEDSLVLTIKNFERLGFLLYFGEKGSENTLLSQNASFFASSDPDMPAVPVPALQIHDWLLENISFALERIAERVSTKENGPPCSTDQDVPMSDVLPSSAKGTASARGPIFIEGISKSSCLKKASDVQRSSLKVVNCHESVIYILAPLRYATVYGCSDATIFLGAVGKAVRVEHCERVHVITSAKRICIANCRECVFFLGVNQQPLIVGDNHKLQVAPYNTYYSDLEDHLNQVGIDTTINRWDEPVTLGMVDPHDSISHPVGISDVQTESASRVDPDQFTIFWIPNWFEGESSRSTKDNPFPLPDAYVKSQQRNHQNFGELKQTFKDTQLEDKKKQELSSALHAYFKDWLYASGNIRQLYCQQND